MGSTEADMEVSKRVQNVEKTLFFSGLAMFLSENACPGGTKVCPSNQIYAPILGQDLKCPKTVDKPPTPCRPAQGHATVS